MEERFRNGGTKHCEVWRLGRGEETGRWSEHPCIEKR